MLSEVDWRRWPRYHRSTWSRFDLVQVFTERDAEGVGAVAPEIVERVRVNPFGLVLPDPLPPAPEASRELVFFGNFTHPPNVDAALWLGSEIMPALRARDGGTRLTVIGPAAPPDVQALAAADIRVTGRVPDLTPYLESAAVVVAPLRIGGGQRMKVLESLARGRSVVTTSRGAEGLEHAGEPPVVVADSVDAFVQAVATLLESPRERQRLATRGREFAAAHHSPEAYALRLERVYEEARARRSAL